MILPNVQFPYMYKWRGLSWVAEPRLSAKKMHMKQPESHQQTTYIPTDLF